jgi:hypothetical protein
MCRIRLRGVTEICSLPQASIQKEMRRQEDQQRCELEASMIVGFSDNIWPEIADGHGLVCNGLPGT